MNMTHCRCCLMLLLLLPALLGAQEPEVAAPLPPTIVGTAKAETASNLRALIVCGLLGDTERRKLYAETVERLYLGLTTHHGFKSENVVLLWSDTLPEDAGPALNTSRGTATREALASAVSEIEGTLLPSDALWVFVLGHSHFDGRHSWLNLPGPDMQHVEFGKMFSNIQCREQVFFMTGSVSGFHLKSLAAANRIVITSTEADLEVNETLFPHHLAKALAEPPSFRELDIDEDGRLTLLDVYLITCREVAAEYAAGMNLATEHALLDDTGDGRGSEVQADYLTEELGGRWRTGRPKPVRRVGDGALARHILLDYPPSPPSPNDDDGLDAKVK